MTTPDQVLPSETHDTISERAADFFARRRFGGWSDADQTELDAWIAESYLHRVAYVRVEGIAARTDRLAALRPPKPVRAASVDHDAVRHRRFLFPLLAAASIVLFAALGLPFVSSLVSSLMQPPVRSLSTDVGGRNLLRFVDGTELELNTDTAVRYRMTNQERVVWLDRGEVWFHVAHNSKNPFAVVIGKHRVTDLGTEFLVRHDSTGIEVALLKGSATLGTDGVQTVTLRPGDDATATPVSVSVIRKTPRQLADKLAWRDGMLVFRNTRLVDAFREFNRYNTTKLVIVDPSIDGVKISTNLRADDLEKFVQLTEGVLNLRVDREGNEFLFSRRPGKETRRVVPATHDQ
jgi:transmembrane sensor